MLHLGLIFVCVGLWDAKFQAQKSVLGFELQGSAIGSTLIASNRSGNPIHLPLSQYKLCALNIRMPASLYHPKANKLLDTFHSPSALPSTGLLTTFFQPLQPSTWTVIRRTTVSSHAATWPRKKPFATGPRFPSRAELLASR